MIIPQDEFTQGLACDHFYSFTLFSINYLLIISPQQLYLLLYRSNCFSIVYMYIIYIFRRYIHRHTLCTHVCVVHVHRDTYEANVPYTNTNLYINIIMYKHRAMVLYNAPRHLCACISIQRKINSWQKIVFFYHLITLKIIICRI